MEDITNISGVMLTPDQLEKAGKQFSKDHNHNHNQNQNYNNHNHNHLIDSPAVRRSPRLNSPSSPIKSLSSSSSSPFKAKIKASPGINRVLTPLKKQASKTALLALQVLSSPSRRVPEESRAPKALVASLSSGSISTPKKKDPIPLWRNTVPGSVFELLSKEELKRQELIFELIYTEENYIKDLNLMVNSFLLPINQIPTLKQGDVDTVFAGIEDIMSVNDALLSDLRERQRKTVVVEQIGDILLKRAESFLCYATYIGGRPKADVHLALINKNLQVAAVFKENLQKEECRKLDFANFLDQPRRRLSKYTCLFAEINRCTPENHPDRAQFSEGWAKLQEVLAMVDEQAGDIMTEFHLQHLKNRLITKDEKQKESLAVLEESTCVIHQDKLKHVKDSKDLEAFLLDNCLVLAKDTKGDATQLKLFKQVFPIEALSVIDLADLERGTARNVEALSTDSTTFRLTFRGAQDLNIVLAASSTYAKDEWIQYLQPKTPIE